MNLLLVILLGLLFTIVYFANGKRIVSVSFISTGVFLLSAIVLFAFDKTYFEYEIAPFTVFIIVFSNLLLFLGEFITLKVLRSFQNDGGNRHFIFTCKSPYHISFGICFFVFVIGVIVAVIDYYYLYQYSLTLGNPGEIWNAIAYTRVARVNSTDFSLPRILSYTGIIIKAISYFCFFFFAYNFFVCKKMQIKLLLPLISYCLIYFSSTERLGYIEIVAVCIVISLVVLSFNGKRNPIRNIKSLLIILIIVASTIVVFYLLGSFSGKTARHDFAETICKYLGASIVGLDSYLRDPWPNNAIPLEQTLYYFYYLLNAVGFNLPITKSFLPFFYWANGSSNIYTCLVAPIQDLGIPLALISRLLIGVFYGWFEYKIESLNSIRNHVFVIVIFSLFFYPVAISSVADMYMSFLQLNYIYFFVAFALIVLIMPRKKEYLIKKPA